MAVSFPNTGIDLLECGSSSDIDNLFAGSGATVMAWVRLNSYGGGLRGAILDKSNGNASAGWELFGSDIGDRLVFNQRWDFFGDIGGSWATPTNSLLADGTWYHVAITFDRDSASNNPLMYIDGVSQTVSELESPFGSLISDAANPLTIGGVRAGGRGFDGSIEDVRIFSSIQSSAVIKHIYAMRGRDRVVEDQIRRWPLPSLPTPYRDHSRASNPDTNSITVPVPNHVESQDTLVLIVCFGGDASQSGVAPNITTPDDWTQRLHIDAPSTASRPVLAVYTRTPSSEPADYTVTADQTCPNGAFMIAYKGLSSEVHLNMETATGVSASPSSPTATPGLDAMAIRIVCFDDEADMPSEEATVFPTNFPYRRDQISDSNGSDNGFVLAFGEELFDAAATGAVTWNPAASEEWIGVTATYGAGHGIEELPVKDVASRQHGECWGKAVSSGGIVRAK